MHLNKEIIPFKVKNIEPVIIQEIIDYDGTGHDYEMPNFYKADGPNQTLSFYRLNEDGSDVPGTTNEIVLRILINRMQKLNAKFPCRENALAITKLEEALMWLHKRTEDRIERNVEGKHER